MRGNGPLHAQDDCGPGLQRRPAAAARQAPASRAAGRRGDGQASGRAGAGLSGGGSRFRPGRSQRRRGAPSASSLARTAAHEDAQCRTEGCSVKNHSPAALLGVVVRTCVWAFRCFSAHQSFPSSSSVFPGLCTRWQLAWPQLRARVRALPPNGRPRDGTLRPTRQLLVPVPGHTPWRS